MSAREVVLNAVRRANAPASSETLEAPAASYRRRGMMSAAERQARFVERLNAYGVRVICVGTEGEVAAVIAELLSAAGARSAAAPADLPAAWRAPGLEWRDADDLDAAALDLAPAAVTGCALAIAETGSLVLDGGVAQGHRALTLLPDHHICVVRAETLVESVPEALERLEDTGAGTRPLTFISGPSATADIEFDRVAGVHGPRRLEVVFITTRRGS